jgi:hypothetical protein
MKINNGTDKKKVTSYYKLLIPFWYTITSRYSKTGAIISFCVFPLAYNIITILFLNGEQWSNVSSLFLLAFFAFNIIYEIGYFENDFVAQKRESAGWNKARGKVNVGMARSLYLVIQSLRILIATGLVVLIGKLGGTQLRFRLICFLLLTVSVFLSHNRLRTKYRFVTFCVLQHLKGLLALVVVGWSTVAVGIYFAISIGMTWGYFNIKNRQNRAYYLRAGFPITNITLVAIPLILMIIWSCRRGSLDAIFGWRLLTYYIVIDCGYRLLSFIKAYHCLGRDKNIYHLHTDYSHDGSITLSHAKELLSGIAKESSIYFSEHAEDFDRVRYAIYIGQVRKDDSKHLFKPGLEYNVLKQHVLAYNLEEYVPVDACTATSIKGMYDVCQFVVWAHPTIGFRKIWNPRYLLGMVQIAWFCEGLEWSNKKSIRLGRNYRRGPMLCILAALLKPGKRLVRGYDAHSKDDYMALLENDNDPLRQI